ncbi:Subtilisin DY [Roseovarius litorisediminis]|uniref:Subtilisin DY n=1 Tax=Roseovarius litorisediminis TaxID=1312363 RepID=A0A1Y5SW82_9RHOB|nr:S8 family serine peptidase [Roseovarius litorisediminis]SLN49202.1 Subtilisin DY [Roseovarius litorisediminis]
MSDRENDSPDLARRRLLKRIGLAGVTIYSAPALTNLGVAHASGGGDGGGGDGGGGSGGGDAGNDGGPGGGASGGGGGSSGPSGSDRGEKGNNGGESGRDGGADNAGISQTQHRRKAANSTPKPPTEIVMFLPAASKGLDRARAAGYSVQATATNTVLGGKLYRLSVPSGRSIEEGRKELRSLVPDSTPEVNHFYTPDDFLCDDGACAANEMIGWSGWPSIYAPRIGMIDTGINLDHDALSGQNLTVHQVDLDGRQSAGRKHGTAIAAMFVGRMDQRVPGLLPNAELVAVEAFHKGSSGDQADVFSLVQAVDILLEAKVSVINMSFSGPENSLLEQVVERAAAAGVAVVAAAGNNGPGAGPAYPAAFERVLAVTAVDKQEHVYRQANRGPYINFAAPGVGVWVAASISGGRLKSGTSYAAPFVTASLAVQLMRLPNLPLNVTIGEMMRCAKDLGDPGVDPVFGNGLVAAPGQCFADEANVFPASGE